MRITYSNKKNLQMKKNMGSADKIIHILLAIIIGVLYYTNVINGTIAIVLGALAVVFVLTSFIGFCPLYMSLGIKTYKNTNTK